MTLPVTQDRSVRRKENLVSEQDVERLLELVESNQLSPAEANKAIAQLIRHLLTKSG